MKQLYFRGLLLIAIFCAKDLCAQQVRDLSKYYEVVSMFYPIAHNDKQHFPDVTFRLGRNKKAPYAIGVQFVNNGEKNLKFKFVIEDVTLKKMIILDTVHHSNSGFETLKPNAQSLVWSGLVENIKDSFSLHIWDGDGDKFNTAPISINDPLGALTVTITNTFTPTFTPTITQTPCDTPVGCTTPPTCKSFNDYMGYEEINFPHVAYVDGIWVYGSSTAAPTLIQAGLYADGGRAPTTLIRSSHSQIRIQGWQYIPFAPVLITPGNAWIGVYMSNKEWMIGNGDLFLKSSGQMPSKPVSVSFAGNYQMGAYADTGRDTIPTPTATNTYTFTPSPTSTSTPLCGVGGCDTPTNTPTWNPTPLARIPQVIAYFGDSFLGYCQPNPFPNYVDDYLNIIYPGTSGIIFGNPGYTSEMFLDYCVGYDLASIWTRNLGPMERSVLMLGLTNEVRNYNPSTCDSCVIDQTAATGISLSYVYKVEMQKIISDIINFQPNVKLVLCTLPDPNNNGAGPYIDFCPQAVKIAFNQRIIELAHDNNLRVADLYTALMGCTSCYGTSCDNLHPSQRGDLLIAQKIEEQFSNR